MWVGGYSMQHCFWGVVVKTDSGVCCRTLQVINRKPPNCMLQRVNFTVCELYLNQKILRYRSSLPELKKKKMSI